MRLQSKSQKSELAVTGEVGPISALCRRNTDSPAARLRHDLVPVGMRDANEAGLGEQNLAVTSEHSWTILTMFVAFSSF